MKEKKGYYKFTNVQILVGLTAFVFSWVVNHSFLWGVLHFLIGKIYIVYWLLKYGNIETLIKTWLMA